MQMDKLSLKKVETNMYNTRFDNKLQTNNFSTPTCRAKNSVLV